VQLRPPRFGPARSELSLRQREVLDELESIFVDEGFAHLTVADLAARLHCSRRTLYEIAPTKDELVLVVLDRRLRHLGSVARAHVESIEGPLDQVEAFMVAGTSELKQASLNFQEDVARFPAARRLFASHFRYATALIVEMIDAGIESGAFRVLNSRVLAEVIDASLERLQDPDLLRASGLTIDEAVAEYAAFVRRGIALDTPSSERLA